MKIYDLNDNIIDSPDLAKGQLKTDRRLVRHHEAIREIKEIGHYEVVAEYPNGGKDVEWCVDVPGVAARDAWDEYEDILRFVPFTEAETVAIRMDELKALLRDTDYHILKIVEGAATLVSCAEIIKQRAAWRREINELEERIKAYE